MKLLKLTVLSSMLLILWSFTFLKPPQFIKGSAKDIEVLKSETAMDVKFEYQDLMVSKIPEKEWVAKQKQKGVDDPQKATEEFNKFWYSEVVPYQGELFMKWYNNNCQSLFKLTQGTKTKYTLTIKPVTLLPYNNFGTIAVLTSDAVISETESGKVLAIVEVPNINSSVPAIKERVALAYGGAGKALALFLLKESGK